MVHTQKFFINSQITQTLIKRARGKQMRGRKWQLRNQEKRARYERVGDGNLHTATFERWREVKGIWKNFAIMQMYKHTGHIKEEARIYCETIPHPLVCMLSLQRPLISHLSVVCGFADGLLYCVQEVREVSSSNPSPHRVRDWGPTIRYISRGLPLRCDKRYQLGKKNGLRADL